MFPKTLDEGLEMDPTQPIAVQHLSEPFRNAYTLTFSPLKDLDYKDPYSENCIVFLGFQSCIENDKSKIDFGVNVLYKMSVINVR